MKKPFVLLLLPGPTYRPRDRLWERLVGLSREFEGVVVTPTPGTQIVRVGSFSIVPLADKRGLVRTVMSFMLCIRNVAKKRRRKGGIDLVVTYDPLKTGLLGLYARALTGARQVCEVNGDYSNPANYFDITNPLLRLAKRWAYIRVQRFVLRRADAIRLLYEGQLKQLRLDTHCKVIGVLPDFVKTSRFSPRPSERVILTVGFPVHVKGIDVLIEAFKSLSAEFPEWRLKVLGYYPRREELERLIAAFPRIEIHKPVPAAEMPEHIGRCGIFVLASRTEGVPRVLVEAMAAGKPRIGTTVGGIPSVIDHEHDGLLVPPNDAVALADALRRLLKDERLRQALGQNGYTRARRFFTEECYLTRTSELYKRAIDLSPV